MTGSRRREIDPAEAEPRRVHRLLTAVVVPRPIAWVSTTSATGVDNLAPHSFFTVACVRPPIVQFTSIGAKDTLANVVATGEFVVNLAPVELVDQVNATSAAYPAELSEFDQVGVGREPSRRVRPPRVAASPVALECVLERTVELGTATLVLGRVVQLAVAERVLDGEHPEIASLAPLSRLGRDEWGAWTPESPVLRLERPRYPD